MSGPRVPRPARATETRHHRQGKTCHHYAFHGLTCDEYDALKERAAGCCELCGLPEEATGGRRLVVDHFADAQQGLRFVRGLICDKCNVVMSCLDGTKPWGSKRTMEAQALAYEARSWHPITSAEKALLAEIRQRRCAALAQWRSRAA
jgi:hypothetical protein